MKDTGCFLHDSCLTCPEEVCILDRPGGKRRYKLWLELQEQLAQGKDLKEAAEALSIHQDSAELRYRKMISNA